MLKQRAALFELGSLPTGIKVKRHGHCAGNVEERLNNVYFISAQYRLDCAWTGFLTSLLLYCWISRLTVVSACLK